MEGNARRSALLFSRIKFVSCTYQFSVSGLIVLRLPLCFAQVLQLAFSNLTPFAIWVGRGWV